jgi:signal transduction histidine kinase/DNA-binding response OmpR family regulator/ligand-binding sensor domain-containing protein
MRKNYNFQPSKEAKILQMLKTYRFRILNSFYLLSIILFLLNPDILSQNKDITTKWPEPKFEHITMKDGLPDQSVWCILQDHLGFMWFGNLTGLVKYDGYLMTVYSHYSENKVDKSFNPVNTIYEDRSGIIWIGTGSEDHGSLKRFDRASETFKEYVNDPKDTASISSGIAFSFCEDSKGRFWVGTIDGLNLMDRNSERFERFFFPKSVPEKKYSQCVTTIFEDQLSGNLIVGSFASGLWSFDPSKRTFSKINLQTGTKQNVNFGRINNLTRSSDGTIWISTDMGLVKYKNGNEVVKLYQAISSEKYTPENDFITGIVEMDELILAGTLGGKLACLDPEKEMFKLYSNDADDPNSLSTSSIYGIRALLKDRSGVLWVSAADFGLNKWDRFKTKFSSYRYDEDQKKSLGNNQIMSMIEDRTGIIWIGTFGGGFIKYNRKNNDFTRFTHNSNNGNSLSDNTVQTICEDPEVTGVLWIGTAIGGLNKFDSRTNQFLHYLHDPNDVSSLSNNYVMYLLPDEKNILWVCTFGGGLDKFDIKSGKFTHYLNNPEDSTSINSNSVWYCYKDHPGTLWVGASNNPPDGGLNRFDINKQTFKTYTASDKNWDVSSSLVICEDKLGNFWVGDLIAGLYLFDRHREEYVLRLTQNDGLSFNAVMSILEDETGNLWISTYNGLSKFDPVKKKFRNYYEEDGLSHNKFFWHSAFKSSTGEFYFGGENGFTWFYPEDIKDDPVPPLVAITKLSLFNRPEEKLEIDGFISEIEKVELPYNHNDLRFDYVGLHFGDPSKNKYNYMLENFDEDWVDAGTQRNATYTNLNPGEYVFRVKAANHDGVWNEEGKSLRIIINHPYWATWWAYGLYFLFAIGLIYSLRKYEVNRLRLKNQVKLDEALLKERVETDKMKSRFFANISHEFRTPLTLISGPLEKILSKHSDEETIKQAGMIKRNAARLLGLINQLLDLSKLEAGKLQLKTSPANMVSFIRGITMSFESIAERKDIALKVKSELEKIEVYFDKDMMAKILSNLLSNAFKFTPEGGEITVSLSLIPSPSGRGMSIGQGEGKVQITVSDTGIGISQEELPKLFDRFYQVDSSQTREYEGSGLGLALTKELVELHRGTIKAKSKLGEGSEFIIELPLGREHLKDDEIVETTATAIEGKIIDESIYFWKAEANEKSISVNLNDDKNIILVVEDNADVREYIKDSLGNSFQVEEAMNGEQGVRKAEQIIPDLIISDIMMPRMDGNELARRIKNDERTSHIPIILLTAKSEQESKLEGLETGADDYLTKPFDTKELLVRIKNLIAIRRKLQEKYSGEQIILKKDSKKLSTIDEKFLCKVLEVVENHLSEEEFSIEDFGEEVGMSRVQLHRKLKALTGKSASLYLRSVRLAKAKEMIEDKKENISEIAYSVGFSSPAYFTACFKEEFGYPPSEIAH